MPLPGYTEASNQNPTKLFLYSHTKVGKTTLASALPNNLIIDTENGSNYVNGIIFNAVKESKRTGVGMYTLLKKLAHDIEKANAEKGDYVYDYITFDTITGIEELAHKLATYNYKKSVVGKAYTGENVVRELPSGGGYMWLRDAFEEIYSMFDGLSKNCLIFLGHVKSASINREGKELNAQDIALVGKLKLMMAKECDAIGYLYRNKEDFNQVFVSFKTSELDLASGARSKHLRNQEFIISELINDKFQFHWDKIFLENKGDKNG